MSNITFNLNLNAGALALWDAADLNSQDWTGYEATRAEVLWMLCEVLRGYESPEWGNTSGRYGHTGGWLDLDTVEGLDESDLTDEDGEPHPALSDFPDPFPVWAMAQWAADHGESDLLTLADALSNN